MLKIMLVFGTRPEAIKMAPLVKEMENRKNVEAFVCVTAQHREMLDQVLTIFDIKPKYDLNVMHSNQSLASITSKILEGMDKVISFEKPDVVLVHGDTTTAYVSALAAFYNQVKIGHVEAGLRTYKKYSPFPEELNRQMIDSLSDYYFTPTKDAALNLYHEGVKENNVFITGNTAIDALKTTVDYDYNHSLSDWIGQSKLILLTAHRRENLGDPLKNIFKAINKIIDNTDNVKVIYPIHLNPLIRDAANKYLKNDDKIKIISPLDVLDFHNLMNKSYLILTDSGGIQEEAPALGKPVLVLRDTTERPEGVEAGTLKLIGTSIESIYENTIQLLTNEDEYKKMACALNPYGDGTASKQIADALIQELNNKFQ